MTIARIDEQWRQIFSDIQTGAVSKPVRNAILGAILALVLVIRLVTINVPQLQYTAWKEIDYLYLSQNFWQHGFNLFNPEVSWPAEPPRVTEMELPIVPYAAAWLYQFFGFNALTARGITLLSALLMVIYVYKLCKRELGTTTGLIAAFTAGVLPLYHPFNRLLFSEPTMIALSVVSLYYIAEWVDYQRRRDWWIALAVFSLTIALKLETLYLFLPIAWIAFRKYRFNVKQYRGLALMILGALVVPVLWYSYAYYLETVGAHLFGVFRGHNKSQTLFMLTQPGWYRTMAGRVIKGILGGIWGTGLMVIGLAAAARARKAGLFFAYLLAVLIYFVLVAEGNVDAPYRQLPIIPSASVFVALGIQALFAAGVLLQRRLKKAAVLTPGYPQAALLGGLALVLLIPLMNIRAVFAADGPVHPDRWQLAQELRSYTDADSKLVVIGEYTKHVGGYDLSPVLYYYTGLQGWSLTPADWTLEKIAALQAKGATYLVVLSRYDAAPAAVNYQAEASPEVLIEAARLRYPVLYENSDQIIFDLR